MLAARVNSDKNSDWKKENVWFDTVLLFLAAHGNLVNCGGAVHVPQSHE